MNDVAQAPVNSAESATSARPTTCRMFENDFLEKFSRIHPVTPFVVYIPLLSFVTWRSHERGLPLVSFFTLGFAGFFAWTLTEYLLHRSIFHWTNDTAFGKRFHFLAHGVHHDYPNDSDR